MNPGEHIEAAKACALVFVDEGRPNKAVSTFIAALRKHPATASIITADKAGRRARGRPHWRLLRARLDQQLLMHSHKAPLQNRKPPSGKRPNVVPRAVSRAR